MERLTGHWAQGGYAAYDPIDILGNDYSKINYHKLVDKLGEYEDLEEQGLLLRLPCKIGDTAYWIEDYEIYSDKVNEFEVRKENGEYIFCIAWMDFKADDFGKNVFFTREEAEQKMKEMGE